MVPFPRPALSERLSGQKASVSTKSTLPYNSEKHWRKQREVVLRFKHQSSQQSYHSYLQCSCFIETTSPPTTISLKSVSICYCKDFSHLPHYASHITIKSIMERNFNTSLFTNVQCRNLVKCWVCTTSVRFYTISAQAFVCLAQLHQNTVQMSATFPLRKKMMSWTCSPGTFLHSIYCGIT